MYSCHLLAASLSTMKGQRGGWWMLVAAWCPAQLAAAASDCAWQ